MVTLYFNTRDLHPWCRLHDPAFRRLDEVTQGCRQPVRDAGMPSHKGFTTPSGWGFLNEQARFQAPFPCCLAEGCSLRTYPQFLCHKAGDRILPRTMQLSSASKRAGPQPCCSHVPPLTQWQRPKRTVLLSSKQLQSGMP